MFSLFSIRFAYHQKLTEFSTCETCRIKSHRMRCTTFSGNMEQFDKFELETRSKPEVRRDPVLNSSLISSFTFQAQLMSFTRIFGTPRTHAIISPASTFVIDTWLCYTIKPLKLSSNKT